MNAEREPQISIVLSQLLVNGGVIRPGLAVHFQSLGVGGDVGQHRWQALCRMLGNALLT